MDDDNVVELDVIKEDIMLLTDDEEKKKIELIKLHLEEECTGVITLENIFKRDLIRNDELMEYERLLWIAMSQLKMFRHDFIHTPKNAKRYGVVEMECRSLANLIEYLKFWGPRTSRNLQHYTLDNHEAECFHIESVLSKHIVEVNGSGVNRINHVFAKDYRLDHFMKVLQVLQARWNELSFTNKCRLREKCKVLLDKLLEEPPVERYTSCDGCCIS